MENIVWWIRVLIQYQFISFTTVRLNHCHCNWCCPWICAAEAEETEHATIPPHASVGWGGLTGTWEEFVIMLDVKNQTNSSKLDNINDDINEIELWEVINTKNAYVFYGKLEGNKTMLQDFVGRGRMDNVDSKWTINVWCKTNHTSPPAYLVT